MIDQEHKSGLPPLKGAVQTIDPAAPPDLAYTVIKSIVLAGKELPSTEHYWNSLLVATIRKASETTPINQTLALIICSHEVGQKKDRGFKYIPDLGISIQAQSAANAWRTTHHILRMTGISLELEFQWENFPSAAFPGLRATIRVGRS
jgi:hypothetical protein